MDKAFCQLDLLCKTLEYFLPPSSNRDSTVSTEDWDAFECTKKVPARALRQYNFNFLPEHFQDRARLVQDAQRKIPQCYHGIRTCWQEEGSLLSRRSARSPRRTMAAMMATVFRRARGDPTRNLVAKGVRIARILLESNASVTFARPHELLSSSMVPITLISAARKRNMNTNSKIQSDWES